MAAITFRAPSSKQPESKRSSTTATQNKVNAAVVEALAAAARGEQFKKAITPEQRIRFKAAILKGDEALVRLLIENNKDLANEQSNEGAIPLHFAIREKRKNICQILLANGADPQATKNGKNALHVAVIEGNNDIVELLVHGKGLFLEEADDEGNTPLLLAVQFSSASVCNTLLARGANANAKNKEGCTALHLAISNNKAEQVNLLLKKDKGLLEVVNGGCVA
jgi:ankyrin repeat protein